MRSLLKQNWPLVLALVITTITQIAYWVAKSELGNCYDCGEYQDLANFISRDPKNIISDLRPPLYPIFLIAVGLASPSIQGDFNLYLFQSVFLVLSLIVFWRLIKTSGLPQFLSWIPILLLAISPAFYSFTKFKMTETINMFLLLTLITLALKLKERLSLKDIFVFCVVSVIATFLRFANSYLAFVMLLGIFVYYRKNLKYDQNLIKLGLAVVLIVIPQVLYSFANLHRNYYYGLTGETGTNLLGKLVQYQLIPKKDPQFQEIINAVSGCTGPLASSDVYTCVWNFLPKNSFVSKYSATNQYVDAFTKKYIVLNLPTYILKSIPVAFEAVSAPADMYLVLSQTSHPLFVAEKAIAVLIHKILVVWLFILLPLFLILFWKKIFKNEYFIVLLFLTICLYYVAITGLAAINDYQRIATPALPLLYFLMTFTTYKLTNVTKIKQK